MSSNWMKSGAFTMGNLLTVPNVDRDNYELLQHEFGHYIQSRIFGPFWMPLFGLPSIINAEFGGLVNDWRILTLLKYENSLYTEWNADNLGRKNW